MDSFWRHAHRTLPVKRIKTAETPMDCSWRHDPHTRLYLSFLDNP